MEMVRAEFMDEICEVNKTGNVVLEFGLQTIHKDEMRLIDRGNNMRRVVEVLTQTRERNIDTEVSLIFGLPGQTVKSFEESVNFCIEHNVKTIHAFPLMLLRGTPLHENKKVLGLVESNEVASEHIPRIQDGVIPHVIQSKTFDHAGWLKMAELAERLGDRAQH
jgi:radical SAM superfamily enzyme